MCSLFSMPSAAVAGLQPETAHSLDHGIIMI